MKKLIIVRKIHMRIKPFAAPFFKHFHLSLNRKNACGNEIRDIETKHIQASAADLLVIRIGILNWCKKSEKNRLPFLG